MSLWKAMTGYWSKGGSTGYDKVRIDGSTNSLQTIEYEHHEIHQGSTFSVHIDNTTANTNDHRTLVGFETPDNTKWLHMVFTASASSAAEVFLVEGVTIDDDEGTEIVALDRNRNTANTSTILSLQNPAVAGSVTWMLEAEIADATFSYVRILDHAQLVAGSGPKALGGTARATREWILDQGIKYAIWVQNVGASVNLHEIHLDWYEHVDAH